jgi:hypothetical protein
VKDIDFFGVDFDARNLNKLQKNGFGRKNQLSNYVDNLERP